jgi:hypothetical protein
MTNPQVPGSNPYTTRDAAAAPLATGVPIASYSDYAAAQRAVDYLSDQKFPVERTSIVGSDLRLVEAVTGRLTVARAALAGAATGAWLGLLLGLLLGLFTDNPWGWLGTVLTSIVIFVFWGAVFGAVAHAFTGGRRDFASRSAIVAGRYDIIVSPEYADRARELLSRLP